MRRMGVFKPILEQQGTTAKPPLLITNQKVAGSSPDERATPKAIESGPIIDFERKAAVLMEISGWLKEHSRLKKC